VKWVEERERWGDSERERNGKRKWGVQAIVLSQREYIMQA
jgi:hypothetical protein